MSAVPWANFKNPRTQKVAEDYLKRSGGKTFDTNSGYSYDGIFVIADVLERAKSTDPDVIVDAIRKTNYAAGLMQYAGPVIFNEHRRQPQRRHHDDPDPRPEAGRGLAEGSGLAEVRVPASETLSGAA